MPAYSYVTYIADVAAHFQFFALCGKTPTLVSGSAHHSIVEMNYSDHSNSFSRFDY
jgi:hypothetical protein